MWSRVGAYLRAKLIVMAIVGALTYVALLLIGVPFALLLAIIVALGELIPRAGPWLARIPLLGDRRARGLATFGLVFAASILIENGKGYFISPYVEGDQLDIHPLLVFVSVLVGATLGGFAGAFVAVPARRDRAISSSARSSSRGASGRSRGDGHRAVGLSSRRGGRRLARQIELARGAPCRRARRAPAPPRPRRRARERLGRRVLVSKDGPHVFLLRVERGAGPQAERVGRELVEADGRKAIDPAHALASRRGASERRLRPAAEDGAGACRRARQARGRRGGRGGARAATSGRWRSTCRAAARRSTSSASWRRAATGSSGTGASSRSARPPRSGRTSSPTSCARASPPTPTSGCRATRTTCPGGRASCSSGSGTRSRPERYGTTSARAGSKSTSSR